jgi:transcriptional regulator GlxA family with amidase domain
LKQIAVETGFGNEQNLRRAFLKSYEKTPADIRHAHIGAGGSLLAETAS